LQLLRLGLVGIPLAVNHSTILPSIGVVLAGRLARRSLDEGNPVRQGQVLATPHPAPMDPRQREQAQARLESARALAREAELRMRRGAASASWPSLAARTAAVYRFRTWSRQDL
jgi:multidrug efflux pump subunit AcrA (membrane-fusion protein)